MTTSRTFHALHLDIASHSSDRICYIILPERLKEHTDTVTERYYFSLGEKEKDGKNKRLASVEEATIEAVDLLKSALRKTIVTQRTGAYGKSYSAPYRKVVFNDNILYDYFSYICKQVFAKRMKRIIHIMTCAIVCALSWGMNVYAQDKVYFVPDPESARWSYLEMDGNGATTATMTYSVDSMTGDAVNGTAKVKFERTGKQSSEETMASILYYKFKDGEFTIDMSAFFEEDVLGELIDAAADAEGIGTSEEEKQKAIEELRKLIEISGEVRGIPRYPVIGALPDYEFVFKFSVMSISVKGTERKITGKEKLTTPAGTFDCFIMEETVTTKAMMQKEVEKTVSWYAYGVGLVKENSYDKKGKLVSTTLLNSINW